MRLSRFSFIISAFIAVASAFSSFAARVGDVVLDIIDLAFPQAATPRDVLALATPPRVDGIAVVRSFRDRLLARQTRRSGWPDVSVALTPV